VFDELGIEQDWWRFDHDPQWALDLKKRYNDKAEKIVGRRLLGERLPGTEKGWPHIKELHEIFEAENVWEGGKTGSWWLKQSANTPEELSSCWTGLRNAWKTCAISCCPRTGTTRKRGCWASGQRTVIPQPARPLHLCLFHLWRREPAVSLL
jgi:hypothetical protein